MNMYSILLASAFFCFFSKQELKAIDATVATTTEEQTLEDGEVAAIAQSCWRRCLGRCLGRWTRAKPAAGRAAGTMLKIGEALIARHVIEQLIGELGNLVPAVLTVVASIIHLPTPTPEQLQAYSTAFVACISKGLKETLEKQELILQPATAAQKLAPDLIEVLKAVIVPDEDAVAGRQYRKSVEEQSRRYKVKSLDEILENAEEVPSEGKADKKTR